MGILGLIGGIILLIIVAKLIGLTPQEENTHGRQDR